jgi:adenylate kinase family enzyme
MANRDEVAARLEVLNQPDGILHSRSARSTWRMYGDSPERLRVWEDVIDEYLVLDEGVVSAGRIEVVTAGPPGAGKSTLTSGIAGYRNVDSDLIKTMLLRREGENRTYDGILQTQLPDGMPLMLNELAGLVHVESVQIADVVRVRCMRRGENLIVQGTLSWPDLVEPFVNELAEYGYEKLHIAVAEVDHATAVERSLSRWWAERCDPLRPEGGRFVPRSAIDVCFDVNGSLCVRNANTLHARVRTVLPDLSVSMSDRPLADGEWLRLVGPEETEDGLTS